MRIQNNFYQCQTWVHSLSSVFSPSVFRSLLFFIGALLLCWVASRLFFVFYRISRLRRSLSLTTATPVILQDLLRKYHLEDTVIFVQNDKLFSFCFGFMHPRIYVSSKLLMVMSLAELEAILLHEKHHLDHQDSLLMFVLFLIELFFPFFPVVSDLLDHFRITREINADTSAVSVLGTNSHLVSVLRKMLLVPIDAIPGGAQLADRMLEMRIKYLVQRTAYTRRISFGSVFISIFSLCLLFLFLVTPVTASDFHQQNTSPFCASVVKASFPFSWAIDK